MPGPECGKQTFQRGDLLGCRPSLGHGESGTRRCAPPPRTPDEPNGVFLFSGDTASGNWTFSTFPERGTLSFVVYGDTRDQLPLYTQDERHRLVAEQIAGEEDVLFVINTGDLVQDGNNPDDWDRFFSAAGTLLPNTTYYPVMGNHEENASLYYDIFGLPSVYLFTCGDLMVVVLDSTLWASDTRDVQAAWMDQEFTGWDGWKVVSFHYPVYSSQEDHTHVRSDLRDAWEPVLMKNGVSAVFSGHVHAYEQYHVAGIHHFILATGGAPSYTLSPEKPSGHVASIGNTLGYAVVTINPVEDGMIIRYIEIARVEGRSVIPHRQGIIRDWVLIEGRGAGSADGWTIPVSWKTPFPSRIRAPDS